MKCGFSMEFSTIRRPNRVLTTLKSSSFEIRILSFVHPSKIFFWEGKVTRLKFMPPKRRFWREEQKMKSGFSNHCSRVRVLDLVQPSATSPLFFDNLHFEHFDKSVNHEYRLALLTKCSKWRLSKNRGLVADGWLNHHLCSQNIAFVVTRAIVIIYDFHATFDRGVTDH